jgi:hypothetical protein
MTAATQADTKSKRFLVYNGVATVGSTQFRCATLKQSCVVNRVPVSEITVVADAPEPQKPAKYPQSVKELYDKLLLAKKGDSVTVTFSLNVDADPAVDQSALNTEDLLVYKGVLLGWAPSWFGPSVLRMTIWAIHPLGMLDWSSSILDGIHGTGFDDHKLPSIQNKDEELVPYMLGKYTEGNVTENLWGKVIKPELIRLCRMTRFDGVNADKVATYLETASNDGSEQPLAWQSADSAKRIIMDVRATLQRSASGRLSLWDNLISLSDTYKFFVLGRSTDYSVAPIIPAVGGDTPKLTMVWQRFFPREEFNALARQITQSVGMLRPQGGATGFFDVEAKVLRREFRPTSAATAGSKELTAGTDYFPVPRFLDSVFDPFLRTTITMGLGTEPLFAAGYRLKDEAPEVDTLNKLYNRTSMTTDLKSYTEILMNERQFDGFSAVMQGNLDFNFGPGSNVLIEAPMYRDKSTDDLGQPFVGHVWGVTLSIDFVNKTAGTYVVLSHVRTKAEQAAIVLKNHPLYNKRWVSAPLLKIPKFTKDPENA